MVEVSVGTKLGRYEVVKHLARGGMADLVVARASGLQGFERHVVLKHLRPEQADDAVFVEMFVNEARLAGALHHHNIVQVLDIGQEDGKHYFTMEYVHGEDVRRLLEELSEHDAQPPIEHVIAIMTAVAAALHHAHEQKGSNLEPLGIVHRDVSPANIIVAYDGNVKVLDFGIAKAAMTSKTQGGMLKGKVPYMAPEQCTGNPVDRRSDVFALGIVLYELVTVRRLFKGDNEFFTMSMVVEGEIPRPSLHRPDLPTPLEDIILKALSREPSDRYQTADEMRAALEDFADKAGLRMSASALAAYMKKLFGKRPEPWMADAEPTMQIKLDFDGSRSALVSPSAEVVEKRTIPKSMMTTKGSLIERARLDVLSSELKSVNALPSLVDKDQPPAASKATLPPPRVAPASKPKGKAPVAKSNPVVNRSEDARPTTPNGASAVPVQPIVGTPAKPAQERLPTDVDVETLVISPPPPPTRVVIARTPDREPTAIVTPLPSPFIERPKSRGASAHADDTQPITRDRRWWLAAGIAGAALIGALVVVLTGSRRVDPRPEPLLDLKAARSESPPTPVEPAQPAIEAKPVEPAQPAIEAKPVEPEIEPAPVIEPAIEPVIEPLRDITTKPEPPRPAPVVEPARKLAAKPPVKRTAKAQPKKTAKPAIKPVDTRPKWDPNALFLKKK